LFDPDPDNREVLWLAGRYEDTEGDREEMQSVIRDYNRMAEKRGDVTLCIAAFRVTSKARRRHRSR
jgi:hypothetical protein